MLRENRPHLQRYGTAILAVAIALLVTLLLGPLLNRTPTPLFFVAVMLSVWWGGLRAGLLSTALSALAINYFFIQPFSTLSIHLDDILRMGMLGVVAVLSNILVEGRRRSEETLWKSQAQLRLITNALPTPIAYVDASLRYRFNNQAYEEWFGYSASDLRGKHIKKVIGEAAYHAIQAHVEAVLAGQPVCFEESMPYKNGRTRYIHADYIPDVDKHGEVQGFVALVNDITERQIAQAALREAHDQLEKRVEERTAELLRTNAVLQLEISDRQQAQKHLQFQANVLSQVSDVVVAVDNNRRIIYWNHAAERLYHVKASEAIGQLRENVYQYRWLSPEEERTTGETLATTGYWSGEVIHILKSGEERYVEASVSVLKDTDGSQFGSLAVIRDVTEKQLAKAALKESEERFRLLVEGVKDYAIVMLAPDGRIVSWNSGAERIQGYRAQEIIGQPVSCLYTQEDIERHKPEQKLHIAAAEGRVEEEGLRRRKDGSLFWANVVITALRDNTGNLRGFSKVIRDITERKQAQEELLISDAALQQMPDAILLTDLEGNILRWMGKAEQIFGYSAAEAIGKPVNFLHHPDIKERMTTQIIQEIQETGAFFGEIACLRKDGSEVPIETTAKSVYDKTGKPLFLVGINRDITDRKQAEEDRAQLIREQAARAEAEATHQRMSFLAQASTLLATSLDDETALANVARLAVPYLADWCIIHLVESDASRRRVIRVHADSLKQSLMEEMENRYLPASDKSYGYSRVIQTGKPELISEISDNLLVTLAQDAEQLEMLRQLGLKSNLSVPLIARGEVMGALTLTTAESGRRYEADDLRFAEDLAKRIALAVDNARLYHQAQQALQQQAESLALIDALFAAAPVGVGFLDKELRYIRVNQVLAAINGYSVEEHLGRRFRELLPEMAERFEPQLQHVLDTGEPVLNLEFSGEALGQPGMFGYWLANHYPVRGKDGETIGLGIMIADISDRKRAEDALRRSETLYRTLSEAVPNFIWSCDPDGHTDYVNPRWLEYTGLTLEQLNSGGLVQVNHPDDFPRLMQQWQEARHKGETFESEFRCKGSDGMYRWFMTRAVPLNDTAGNIIKWIGTTTDIHDRKQAEEERNQLLAREQAARAQAEAANRIKDEFLAVLSHELRSPLNPILGWSKLLQTRKLDQAKTAYALETIERNAKLQSQLIEDLLDVSRILQGKLRLNISSVDLVSTIEAAVETVRLAAEAKSIQLDTVLEPYGGKVAGDSNRLQQVVWNLLSNAVKFTPTGGRVQVRLQYLGTQAQIQVSDTGKGINPDFLPYVFDYFRQENSSTTRIFGGLGLGLAIVRHLVELHGGTVGAESPGEGLGATFAVRLPLMKVVLQSSEDNLLLSNSPNLEGVRILIVEDEVDTRELLVFILREYGAQVRAVASASEALSTFANWQPEVLLSDIGMPHMDGYMLIRQIRALPKEQGGEIWAIALTAYAGETDRQQIVNAGFHRHITKPVEPAALVNAIAHLVECNNAE